MWKFINNQAACGKVQFLKKDGYNHEYYKRKPVYA